MDIHKPRPWHNVREFLKEYVIIVVGVLTALGAEQGVEWLHWRHVAAEAEQHLAAGVGPDLVNAAEWVAIEGCQKTRLRDLATALQRPDPTWTANVIDVPAGMRREPGVPLVMGSPGRVWAHVAWDSALASGALTHMPRDRVDLYAEIYHIVEVLRGHQSDLQLADAQLAPLGFDRPLTATERTAFLARVATVDTYTNGMTSAGQQMLKDAQRLGLQPSAKDLSERMANERTARGACVRDVKFPLT